MKFVVGQTFKEKSYNFGIVLNSLQNNSKQGKQFLI